MQPAFVDAPVLLAFALAASRLCVNSNWLLVPRLHCLAAASVNGFPRPAAFVDSRIPSESAGSAYAVRHVIAVPAAAPASNMSLLLMLSE